MRRRTAALERAADLLLHAVWPTRCLACERWLGRAHRRGACDRCWLRLRPPAAACRCCGEPRAGSDLLGPAGGRCLACATRPPAFDATLAAVVYDDTARRFLLGAKLDGRRELLPELGAQLTATVLAAGWAGWCHAVVPVPSHPLHRVRRGFNPAAELALSVGAGVGARMRPSLLRRRWGGAQAQKRRTAAERRISVRRAFAGTGREAPRRVLLVDDVMTTGATAEICARLLLEAGARRVRCAVWARTPRAERSDRVGRSTGPSL